MPAKTLFSVRVSVRPAPHHPAYFEMQCGFLFVFLFAGDKVEACESAVTLAKILSYEVASEAVSWAPATRNTQPALAPAIEEAKTNGFAWWISYLPIGSDETSEFSDL